MANPTRWFLSREATKYDLTRVNQAFADMRSGAIPKPARPQRRADVAAVPLTKCQELLLDATA